MAASRPETAPTVPILPENWPRVIAHRGAPTLAPENTLASFALARELGCRAVELDARLCKSGEIVVSHDGWLDRTAGVHVRLEDLSLGDLSGIDVGSFFNALHPERSRAEFSRERIPTLDEVLETVGPEMCVDIELKADFAGVRLARAVAACLARHGRKNCIVSSFNPFALLAYRASGPHRTAAIYSPSGVPFCLRHRECLYLSGADIQKPERTIALPSGTFGTGKKPVIVWTVDSVAEAKRLLAGGVSSVITNRIQDFVE